MPLVIVGLRVKIHAVLITAGVQNTIVCIMVKHLMVYYTFVLKGNVQHSIKGTHQMPRGGVTPHAFNALRIKSHLLFEYISTKKAASFVSTIFKDTSLT